MAASPVFAEMLTAVSLDFHGFMLIKQNWRWQPPTKEGKPVSVKTRVFREMDVAGRILILKAPNTAVQKELPQRNRIPCA